MSGRFNYSAMYSFDYPDAKTVDVWDRYPLMVPLSISGTHVLGLNLHHVNKTFRLKFLQYLLALSKTFEKHPKRFARTTYMMLKNTPQLHHAMRGIRLYLKNRIKSVHKIDRAEVQKYLTPKGARQSLFQKYRKHMVQR